MSEQPTEMPVVVTDATSTPTSEVPTARIVRERAGLSPVWLLPVGAMVTVVVLLWQALFAQGPTILIRFEYGDGLEPGDPVTFRGVQVGEVKSVRLAEGLTGIIVEARLDASAGGKSGKGGIAVEGSRFWIVRPQVSLSGVSGLETLLGPRYIEADPGAGDAPVKREFVGLGGPPRDRERTSTSGATGSAESLRVVLEAANRGSIREGAPVLYRGVRVGVVESVALAEDARSVQMHAAIEPEWSFLVRMNTKFWNASGIGVDFGVLSGLTLQAGSLESVLEGGIGLATPTKFGELAPEGHHFTLESQVDSDWLEWRPTIPMNAPSTKNENQGLGMAERQ